MSRTAGIGLILVERDSKICVDSLRPGGPAALEGTIQPGDIILAVNGCAVRGLSVCVTLIVGDAGTAVRLRCKRGRADYEVTIFREKQTAKAEPDQPLDRYAATHLNVTNKTDPQAPSITMAFLKSEVSDQASSQKILESKLAEKPKNLSQTPRTSTLPLPLAVPSSREQTKPTLREEQHRHVQDTKLEIHQILRDLRSLTADLSSIHSNLVANIDAYIRSGQDEADAARSELLALRTCSESALLRATSDLGICRRAADALTADALRRSEQSE